MLFKDESIRTPPSSDELEVTLIGPGYGESAAIHVGDGRWFFVDSCVQKGKKEPLPLEYLKAIGHKPTEVIAIVVTHWDDDHIKGLASLILGCDRATIVFADAFTHSDFLKFVLAYQTPLAKVRSGVSEIYAVLHEVVEKRMFRLSAAGTKLFTAVDHTFSHGQPFDLQCLSPSSREKIDFLLWAASQIPHASAVEMGGEAVQTRRVAVPSERNDLSIVLHCSVGEESILLGADLLEHGDPGRGWSAILNMTGWSRSRSSLFKVPHHGSRTAHHNDVWKSLLLEGPVSVVCPWEKGNKKLPTTPDEKRIKTLSRKSFRSADSGSTRFRRSPTVRRTIQEVAPSLEDVLCDPGAVRCRKKIGAKGDWRVELFGSARAL